MPGAGLQTASTAAQAWGHRQEKSPSCLSGSGHLLCLPILTQEKGILIIVTF